MENVSNAKYKMILSTSQRLNQSASLVSTLPTYSAISTQFLSDFSQLQFTCEQLQVSKTAVMANKDTAQKDMADKALDLSLKLKAFARVTGNDSLYRECDINKSAFYYGKNVVARNNAMIIHTKATANLSALASYGVTAALLTALKTTIDAFTLAIPTPAFNRVERTDLVLKRDKYIAACISSLLKIDALVELLRLTQPSFYLQYKEARRIVRTQTKLSMKGSIKDAETGNSIPGVNIDILPASNSLRSASTSMATSTEEASGLNKKSAAKGGFCIKNLPAGTYTINISKYGYAPQQISITVNQGETTKLFVQLEREA